MWMCELEPELRSALPEQLGQAHQPRIPTYIPALPA